MASEVTFIQGNILNLGKNESVRHLSHDHLICPPLPCTKLKKQKLPRTLYSGQMEPKGVLPFFSSQYKAIVLPWRSRLLAFLTPPALRLEALPYTSLT